MTDSDLLRDARRALALETALLESMGGYPSQGASYYWPRSNQGDRVSSLKSLISKLEASKGDPS